MVFFLADLERFGLELFLPRNGCFEGFSLTPPARSRVRMVIQYHANISLLDAIWTLTHFHSLSHQTFYLFFCHSLTGP